MHFSAENLGGTCVGVLSVKATETEKYEQFHGVGSSEYSDEHTDVVLVELPFSAFAGGSKGDPAVTDLIKSALISRNQKAVVFRIPWALAQPIGVEPSEFVQAVENIFPNKNWQIDMRLTDGFSDLFISVAKRKKWNGNQILPAVLENNTTYTNSPQEILIAKGYPKKLALHYRDNDIKLIKEAVSIKTAQHALLSVLNAVGLS